MKTSTLTIRLDKNLDDLLTKASKRSGRNRSEIAREALAVYNCLQVLNDNYDQLIEEKPKKSDKELLDYMNNKLIPKLKEILSPYWKCF